MVGLSAWKAAPDGRMIAAGAMSRPRVHAAVTELHNGHGLARLQKTARAVKTHSLGQVSHALYNVGGEYRRNM